MLSVGRDLENELKDLSLRSNVYHCPFFSAFVASHFSPKNLLRQNIFFISKLQKNVFDVLEFCGDLNLKLLELNKPKSLKCNNYSLSFYSF